MNSLCTVVSQKLEFYKFVLKVRKKTSVTGPGFQIHLLPDSCVHDLNLLDAPEATVKSALEPIYMDEASTANYWDVQHLYNLQCQQGTDLSSEDAV